MMAHRRACRAALPGATIVTYLMAFLIQNTQNQDTEGSTNEDRWNCKGSCGSQYASLIQIATNSLQGG
jgi:Low affinity iron permease